MYVYRMPAKRDKIVIEVSMTEYQEIDFAVEHACKTTSGNIADTLSNLLAELRKIHG